MRFRFQMTIPDRGTVRVEVRGIGSLADTMFEAVAPAVRAAADKIADAIGADSVIKKEEVRP